MLNAERAPVVELRGVSRRFGKVEVLERVDLTVCAGDVHALLGPNGAGKTTMLRILAGLVEPSEGDIRFDGAPARLTTRRTRGRIGLVPSGDRTFYLRISGLENLIFFGRLHGLRLGDARARAEDRLDQVGLADAGRRAVGLYSHGMQKRLSVARALLMNPQALFVDEATHDLDPEGAGHVRQLISDVAVTGTAVVWATQRVDEIRGFATHATVVHRGTVRFSGTLSELTASAPSRTLLLGIANADLEDVQVALGPRGSATRDGPEVEVRLGEGVTVGDALAVLNQAGIKVLSCRDDRSEIERAFLTLTGAGTAET